MSPDRALRPDDFHRQGAEHPLRPAHRDDCPFCSGNEGLRQRVGSSLEHAHSQITTAPVLSLQVCMRLQEARRTTTSPFVPRLWERYHPAVSTGIFPLTQGSPRLPALNLAAAPTSTACGLSAAPNFCATLCSSGMGAFLAWPRTPSSGWCEIHTRRRGKGVDSCCFMPGRRSTEHSSDFCHFFESRRTGQTQ